MYLIGTRRATIIIDPMSNTRVTTILILADPPSAKSGRRCFAGRKPRFGWDGRRFRPENTRKSF